MSDDLPANPRINHVSKVIQFINRKDQQTLKSKFNILNCSISIILIAVECCQCWGPLWWRVRARAPRYHPGHISRHSKQLRLAMTKCPLYSFFVFDFQEKHLLHLNISYFATLGAPSVKLFSTFENIKLKT